MNTWRLGSQTIYEIGPLEEYLAALNLMVTSGGGEQRILLATGDPGVGKTIGALLFCRECKVKSVYVNLPAEDLLRPRDLLDLLADRLGLSSDLRTRYDMARQIADHSLEGPAIIILDGAQVLRRYQLFDVIRWIHDEGAHTFALVGLPILEHVVREHREFGGRILLHHKVRVAEADEVAALFEGYPAEAIEQIHEETGGRMRQVMALRRWLEEMVEQNKLDPESLAPKQVRMVAKHFLVKAA
jgi:DNA transposition AAA+ family ATPase